MFLLIEDYDRAEATARRTASYPAIRAFTPGSFLQANFPTHVCEEIELRRYVDIMYELLVRETWLEDMLYSAAEADAINRLSGQILALTGKIFGLPVQPLMCLFPPWPLVRMVEELSRVAGRRLRVFESGSGSGYVGAYLINAGHQYVAMDVCQALYLWQNRLFGSLCDDFEEWAKLPRTPSNATARVTHIPWWHFANFHKALPFHADVVICDAALSEMDQFALRYLIQIAKKMVEESDVGCFLFQGTGEPRMTPRIDVEGLLQLSGFRRFVVGRTTVFVGSKTFPTSSISDMSEPPHVGQCNPQSMMPPAKFFSYDSSKILESYDFFSAIGLGRR